MASRTRAPMPGNRARKTPTARRPHSTFVRRIEANGEISSRALFPSMAGSGQQLMRCGPRADWFVPLLFATTPPLLLSLYVDGSRDGLLPVLFSCITGGALWIYTIMRFGFFIYNIKVFNDAIAAAGKSPNNPT